MYILAGILIISAIVLLVSASGDLASYASFEDAKKSGDLVKIVGQLDISQEMDYDPQKDPNHFTFFVIDKNGVSQKVLLRAAKPQDFELSEQIVITGKMENEVFLAKDVLLKCPSKYKDEEIYIKSES